MPVPEIKMLAPSEESAWDDYILSNETGGPFLAAAWKNAVEKGYGHKTFYLVAYNGNSVEGVLPLVRIKPPFSRGILVSLPFCDYGGVLANSLDAEKALVKRAVALADEMRLSLEIRNPAPCHAIEDHLGFAQVTDKCRMVLALPGSSVQLWTGFKSKLRSQVKRAGKDGLVARLGKMELLDDFYRVFSINMRDLGSPVHSLEWIKAVLLAFGENVRAAVVYKGDLPIGGGIILMHGDSVTIPWASTLRQYNRMSPNMILYWAFLEYAADHGYSFFDFGRSTPGEGTYAFKKQWGATPSPLSWYRYGRDIRPDGHAAEDGPWRKATVRAWRRLPIAATNALGPHLRKYIDK